MQDILYERAKILKTLGNKYNGIITEKQNFRKSRNFASIINSLKGFLALSLTIYLERNDDTLNVFSDFLGNGISNSSLVNDQNERLIILGNFKIF